MHGSTLLINYNTGIITVNFCAPDDGFMVSGALKELLHCGLQPHGDVYISALITVKCSHVSG